MASLTRQKRTPSMVSRTVPPGGIGHAASYETMGPQGETVEKTHSSRGGEWIMADPADRHLGAGVRLAVHGLLLGAYPQRAADIHGHDPGGVHGHRRRHRGDG